jgi:hypothetical protein
LSPTLVLWGIIGMSGSKADSSLIIAAVGNFTVRLGLLLLLLLMFNRRRSFGIAIDVVFVVIVLLIMMVIAAAAAAVVALIMIMIMMMMVLVMTVIIVVFVQMKQTPKQTVVVFTMRTIFIRGIVIQVMNHQLIFRSSAARRTPNIGVMRMKPAVDERVGFL